MELRKVTADIRIGALDSVESHLHSLGVRGLTVTWVKGCVERSNFLRRDPKVSNVRPEAASEARRAEVIAGFIIEAANTGACGDGLVAILPVDKVWRIRSRCEATEEEFA